jgi:hypothetical protein
LIPPPPIDLPPKPPLVAKNGKKVLRPDEENEEEDSSDEENIKKNLPPPPRQSTNKHYMAPVNRLVKVPKIPNETKEQQARIKKILSEGKKGVDTGSGTKSPEIISSN